MLELIKFKTPTHPQGECFRFEAPVSQTRGRITGIAIHVRSTVEVGHTFATASVSTDDGTVLIPQVAVWRTAGATLNSLLIPVSYEKACSLIRVIFKEEETEAADDEEIEYEIECYIVREGGELC